MSFELRYQQARRAEVQGQPAEAEAGYLALLEDYPQAPNLAFRLGQLACQVQNWDQAVAYFQAELDQRPDFWACRAQLAGVYLSQQQWAAAKAEILQSLQTCDTTFAAPRASLWRMLSRVWRAEQAWQQALEALREAKACQSELGPELERDMAQIYQIMGNFALARFHFQQAWQQSQHPRFLLEAADHSLISHDYTEAQTLFLQAAAHAGLGVQEQALALGQAANCLQELNRPQEALALYARAFEQAPLALFKLSQVGVMPIVYAQAEAVSQWRQRAWTQLQQLAGTELDGTGLEQWRCLPFYLPYQGQNDRDFLIALSAQVQRLLPPLTSGSLKLRRGQRLRVGCVSRFFYRHSVMRCLQNLLCGLAQTPSLELYLISASSLMFDQTTQHLRQAATGWLNLRGGLLQQAQQIQQLELDVLLYTDTQLDPQTYLLSHYRLAPVQALFPGQPVTSGVQTVDYYLSDALSEPPQAAEHYSETLQLFSQPPTVYSRPELPQHFASRTALGLPASQHLYLCAGSAFKLSPEMDPVFQGILRADPAACILVLELSENHLTDTFRQRVLGQLEPQQAQRLQIWPQVPPERFLHLLQAVDLLLEPFPFGSLNTLMSAFAVGTPVLTWPGRFLRGRYAQSLLRRLDCPELIANSADDYVDKAIKVASDKVWQKILRARIIKHQAQIFERPEPIQDLTDWLWQMHGA